MSTELEVKQPSDFIPPSDLPGLENALAQVDTLSSQLEPLKHRARMEVKSAADYASIGEVLTEVRGLRKQGVAVFAPFESIVDRVRNFLRTRKARHENLCEELEGIIKPKMKDWEKREAAEATQEEKTISKQREKAGLPPVSVQPNIPSVAGYRRTTNYYAEVTDFDKFLKAFRLAANASEKERATYLRQFLTVDARMLNAEARRLKDPKQLEKLIPGVRAWSE